MPDLAHPETLRMIERLIVVCGGVISIFLGYRLFAMTTLPDLASGTFKTKILQITLSKAAPGIFFALFGAAILIVSLSEPIKVGRIYGPADAHTLSELNKIIGTLPEAQRDHAQALLHDLGLGFEGAYGARETY